MLLFGVLFLLYSMASYAAPQKSTAMVLRIESAITPAVAEYIKRGFAKAQKQGASLIILQMDTPGGLGKSMRIIIKDILGSSIPVVTYVAPSGARAASAGTYILYASHIAAMAPGTNLGAATPVQIGAPKQKDKKKKPTITPSTASSKKATNDAIAYIKSLAQLRQRNVDWAVKAVQQAASLPANEALKLNVINVVAANIPQLLQKIDGMKVQLPGREVTLATKNLQTTLYLPDWRNRLLTFITNPSVAYILLLIAAYGLFFEFANPGFVLPGVVGAICLLLALYAFHLLPISYVGLGLIILGLAFMIVEAFMPSFGILGVGGVIAFAAGSVMLIQTDITGYGIPIYIIITMTLVNLLFFFVIIGIALRARRQPVVSGREAIIGETGVIDDNYFQDNTIMLNGEIWQCRSQHSLSKGQQVTVTGLDHLTVIVKPINTQKES